jgi:hypothetical protein
LFVIDGIVDANVDKQQSNNEDEDAKFLRDQFKP